MNYGITQDTSRTSILIILQSLYITFDVTVLYDIWNYILDFYHNIFSDYCFIILQQYLQQLVAWHLCQKQFSCTQLHSLHIESNPDNMVETLRLEISKDKNKYIVAGEYIAILIIKLQISHLHLKNILHQ